MQNWSVNIIKIQFLTSETILAPPAVLLLAVGFSKNASSYKSNTLAVKWMKEGNKFFSHSLT